MRRLLALLCVPGMLGAPVAAAAPLPAQGRVAILEHVSFRDATETESMERSRDALQLDIDAMLLVDIDEAGLTKALVRSRAAASPEASLFEKRLELLTPAVDNFLRAQAALLALKVRAAELERQAAATGVAVSMVADPEFIAANNEMADSGTAAVRALQSYRRLLSEERDAARRVQLENDADALIAVFLANDYGAVATALQQRIRDSGEALARALQGSDSYTLLVRADLRSGGVDVPVHVDGYDTIAVGRPEPFPRFRLAPDERTLREYEASKKLKELVDAARDGTLGKELRKARDAVKAELEALRDALKSDVLLASLDKLGAELTLDVDPLLDPLRADVDKLQSLLRTLKPMLGDGAGADLAQFLALAGDFQRTAGSLLGHLEQLASSLPALVDRLIATVANRTDQTSKDVLAALQQTKTALAANPDVQAVVTRIGDLLAAFGLTTRVVGEIADVDRKARELLPDVALDTSIDVRRVEARQPGDVLVVEFIVEHKTQADAAGGAESRLHSDAQLLRLRLYGLYEVPRGALFFADPRNASLSPGQDYEAAPAIGYVFHYGKRDDPFWNDVLDPGIALSVSLLDFEDSADFELGLSAGLTFFKDCLWVGYGRNLQAESSFFYVGINPLVLGDLWGRDEPTRASNN